MFCSSLAGDGATGTAAIGAPNRDSDVPGANTGGVFAERLSA